MRGLLLLFTLNRGGAGGGDQWFAADKAKHFFAAAFVQTASFSAFRAVGASRSGALAGATLVSAAVSIGKEWRDTRTPGGDPSLRDLAWDGVGILAATALLVHTEK